MSNIVIKSRSYHVRSAAELDAAAAERAAAAKDAAMQASVSKIAADAAKALAKPKCSVSAAEFELLWAAGQPERMRHCEGVASAC